MLDLNSFCAPLSKEAEDLLDKLNKQYKDNGRHPGSVWGPGEGEEELFRELVDRGIMGKISSRGYKFTDEYLRYGMP